LKTASPQYPGGPSKFQVSLSEAYGEKWSALFEEKNFAEFIAQHLENRRRFYDLIQRYLTEVSGQRILELGCGTGIDINVIANEKKGSQCFGSDISHQSIKICDHITKLFSNDIRFFVADTHSLPLRSGTFDLVFSQGLVEHFKAPESVIAEQARVLRGGGILIVNVPQKYTGYTRMKKLAMKNGKWDLGWETEFSYSDLKKVGRKLGLIGKEVIGYQYWKSWGEPVFVLRDLYEKCQRRNPWREKSPFLLLRKGYDSFWEFLEKKWGHFFLQNIVIVFQKKS
jgi:ubiquinone/menaquinone biosynthesis C-methylase UbiE